MNSLVGYGLSSDSESEGDGEDGNNGSTVKSMCEADGETPVNKSRNFLVESGSASSESGGESDLGEEDPSPSPQARAASPLSVPSHPIPPAPSVGSLKPNKLPPPPLGACSGSSVFANPFKAQADKKLNVLQKHVPLTLQAKPSQIGGKRMCVAYRKDGRCRFGIKCKFAHDSDLQTSIIPNDYGSAVGDATPEVDQGDSHTTGQQTFPHDGELGETEGEQGKKRRAGLSNTLIPPKRAMKQYALQRDRDRLNIS